MPRTDNGPSGADFTFSSLKEGLNGVVAFTVIAKIWALLRLSVNFFQLRLTKKLKINFFCFKKVKY